jgi:hypothetical protein
MLLWSAVAGTLQVWSAVAGTLKVLLTVAGTLKMRSAVARIADTLSWSSQAWGRRQFWLS